MYCDIINNINKIKYYNLYILIYNILYIYIYIFFLKKNFFKNILCNSSKTGDKNIF